MTQSVREIIGYGKEQEVTLEPLDFKDFRNKIKELNDLPIEIIQKLISPRLVDFEAKNVTSKSKYGCDENSDCGIIEARFEIMYAYDIIGFPYMSDEIFYMNGRKWTDYSNGMYPQSQFFGRKAGFMVSEIVYKHHSNGHSSKYNPFSYANYRSPFGYHTLNSDGQTIYTPEKMNINVVNALFEFKSKHEPTLKNHRKFLKKYTNFKSHVNHSSIKLCYKISSGRCDSDTSRVVCSNVHNEQQVCDRYCRTIILLRQFETHPHMFYSSSNFCFGNNIETNLSFQEAIKNRNPISFIKALIHSCSFITQDDSRGGFEFFSDVFLNSKYIWDNKYMRMLNKLKQYIHVYASQEGVDQAIVEGIIPHDNDHQISFECYCLSCLSIRGAILFGLKIDVDKLVQDRQPYCTADQIQKLIKEFERGKLKDYDRQMIEAFNGNSVESVKGKDFSKISELLAFLVDLELDEIDYKIKLSPIDFRNRIVSAHTTNHTYFIDCKSGKLITPDTLNNDKQRVKDVKNLLKSINNDFIDILPFIIEGDDKELFIDLLGTIKTTGSITENMYEPYQLGLTKKEAQKVNKIIKDYS